MVAAVSKNQLERGQSFDLAVEAFKTGRGDRIAEFKQNFSKAYAADNLYHRACDLYHVIDEELVSFQTQPSASLPSLFLRIEGMTVLVGAMAKDAFVQGRISKEQRNSICEQLESITEIMRLHSHREGQPVLKRFLFDEQNSGTRGIDLIRKSAQSLVLALYNSIDEGRYKAAISRLAVTNVTELEKLLESSSQTAPNLNLRPNAPEILRKDQTDDSTVICSHSYTLRRPDASIADRVQGQKVNVNVTVGIMRDFFVAFLSSNPEVMKLSRAEQIERFNEYRRGIGGAEGVPVDPRVLHDVVMADSGPSLESQSSWNIGTPPLARQSSAAKACVVNQPSNHPALQEKNPRVIAVPQSDDSEFAYQYKARSITDKGYLTKGQVRAQFANFIGTRPELLHQPLRKQVDMFNSYQDAHKDPSRKAVPYGILALTILREIEEAAVA